MDKVKKFKALTDELNNRFGEETSKYGDPFGPTYAMYGKAAIEMKVGDKSNRIMGMLGATKPDLPCLRVQMMKLAFILLAAVIEIDATDEKSEDGKKARKARKEKTSESDPSPLDPTNEKALLAAPKSKVVALAKSLGVKGAKKKERSELVKAIMNAVPEGDPAPKADKPAAPAAPKSDKPKGTAPTSKPQNNPSAGKGAANGKKDDNKPATTDEKKA